MDLFEAIYNRRSIPKVKPAPVPCEMVEKMLSAAVQAPNHYRVRPWRFVVISGVGRERLGEVMVQSLLKRQPNANPAMLEQERGRPLRAPLLIAIGVDKPSEPKVLEIENICAAAAAAQNLLLAAHAMGLAGYWRTGPAALDPDVKSFLGFAPDQNLIAFLYIGYADMEIPQVQRPSYEDRTVWIES